MAPHVIHLNMLPRVVYVTQGHWNCKRLKNTVSPPHFSKTKAQRAPESKSSCRGVLLQRMTLEEFQCCALDGRPRSQAPSPAKEDCKYSNTPLFWWPAFQQKTFRLCGQTRTRKSGQKGKNESRVLTYRAQRPSQTLIQSLLRFKLCIK